MGKSARFISSRPSCSFRLVLSCVMVLAARETGRFPTPTGGWCVGFWILVLVSSLGGAARLLKPAPPQVFGAAAAGECAPRHADGARDRTRTPAPLVPGR